VLPYQLSLISLPAGVPLPVVVIAGVLQSAIVVTVAVVAGNWLSARAGLETPLLDAALERKRVAPLLSAIVGPSVILGLTAALLTVALDALLFLPAVGRAAAPGAHQPPIWAGALASLYGGITEEILLRYGVMSLFAWFFTRVMRGGAAYWAAIVMSAVLFGLGHLPATAAVLPLNALVVARAIVLNGIGGVVFGWLYWRLGLEAAMVGHLSADLVLHVGLEALGG
jgi:hypothetical protein